MYANEIEWRHGVEGRTRSVSDNAPEFDRVVDSVQLIRTVK